MIYEYTKWLASLPAVRPTNSRYKGPVFSTRKVMAIIIIHVILHLHIKMSKPATFHT